MCQNNTMWVYGSWIKTYCVYIQKHIAVLAMCYNLVLVRDKLLGTPASMKQVYSCSLITFNPQFDSRVFVDCGNWDYPGHVVALSQSQPRPAPVAPFLYRAPSNRTDLGELEGLQRTSSGMEIGWELQPRMRSRTWQIRLAHYPVLVCLPGK